MHTARSMLLVLVTGASVAAAQPAPNSTSSTPSPSSPISPVAMTATAGGGRVPGDWTLGVSPRIGFTVPTSKLGAMIAGGFEFDYALPVAHRQLVLAASATLTRPSHDGSVMDSRVPGGAASYTIHQREVVVGVMASYRLLPAGHRMVPWVGAGPILHLLKTTETTSVTPDDNTATSTELGVELGGGLDYRAGPGFVIGDLRVVYSKLDNLLTGASNAGNVVITTGYRLVF